MIIFILKIKFLLYLHVEVKNIKQTHKMQIVFTTEK